MVNKCWIVLMFGRDESDPLFLQVKEAQPSVLSDFVGPSTFNDLASYCTSCGGWRVRGLAGRSGRCGAGGFSVAGESDIFPWCAGASGLAVGVAAA